jgi:hypothetical protein
VSSLLATSPFDLAVARRRLRELHSRAHQLLTLAAVLGLLGGFLSAAGDARSGVPLLIGAAGALGLLGLCRGDRRRLLVTLVAQGDAWSVEGVSELAARLRGPRERKRIADGLRAAADVGSGVQLSLMVCPPRADAVRARLTTLAERFSDPVVNVSATAAAICRRLLCDPQHSPLYNPHLPEEELWRILDLLERDLISSAPADVGSGT